MNATSQQALPFGPSDTERVRDEPWMGTVETRRESLAKQAGAKREKTYARIMAWASQRKDFTADELTADWNCSPNHTAPRCTELLQLGRLRMTGARRRTRSGGMAAVLAVKV